MIHRFFDRFRTDDPWLVNLSLDRISLEEFVLKWFFLLSYASYPAILEDLIGSRVSESCNWSASDVFHSRTKNLRSGRSIPHDLLVTRDHWSQKKREPTATANSVKSIVESSWFLKKVDRIGGAVKNNGSHQQVFEQWVASRLRTHE